MNSMEIISLIYTHKINHKEVSDFLEKEYGFFYLKKQRKNEILINRVEESSIKVAKYKVEIMYKSNYLDRIVSLIENLSRFNQNQKIAVKVYKDEERNNIIQLLNMKKYYFI